MAERTRSESRQQRSDAREQRRSLAAKPFEELDEAADAEERGGGSRSTLRQAAKTALAGALVAGVAGAVKGLADRRGDEPAAEDDSDENPSEPADAEAQDDQPENREQEDPQPQSARVDDAREDEPQSSGEAETQTEQEEPQAQSASGDDAEQDEPPEPNEDADASDGAPRGASSDDAKKIVEEAKRELQELLGAEAESVSGFRRSDGRWTVTVEVVNVRRVPDTTDVMSSYEVAFDDDHNLVSVSETRRYRRSQVEEG